MSQPAPGGDTECLWPHEHQVEQRFLRLDRTGKGGRHGHGLLEQFPVLILPKCVKDERVPNEKLVLKLLDNRFAGARPALPMNMAHRIAAAILAQRDEFLGLADRTGEGNAALLVFERARQRDWRQRVTARENDDGVWRTDL